MVATQLQNFTLTEPRRVTWEMGEVEYMARLFVQPNGDLELWNGWVCPAFDRAEVERVIEYNNRIGSDATQASIDVDTFEWDGDVLLSHYSGDRNEVERIEPIVDDAGELRWTVGAWSWTWQEIPANALTNDECEAIKADGRDGRGWITMDNLTARELMVLSVYRRVGRQ